jgi:hypothetical protein
MVEQSNAIARREFLSLAELPKTPEFRRVVNAMNQMVGKLKALFAEEAARSAKAREQAAAAKGPASPRESCAGETGVIARGFCEARACGKAEWRSHPFCVKRIEEQLRSFGQGGG